MTRRTRTVLGVLLLTLGVAGVLSLGAMAASADERSTQDSHAVMHEMMDAVHGPGTSERMHRVEGADEMMERCSEMMTMMDDGGMMDDSGMMDMMQP